MTAGSNTTWQAKAADLNAAWHARVRARQAAQIAQSEPVEVPLPSGLTVFAVRADLLSFLEAGRVPDALTPYATEILKIGVTGDGKATAERLLADLEDWVRLIDVMWLATVVAPKFRATTLLDDDAIPMRLVDIEDKIAFFNWSNGVADHLAAFRDPGESARTASDGESLRTGPAQDGGNQPGDGALEGVAVPPSDVLRGNHRRKPSQGDALDPVAGPGARAEGPALEPGTKVDLRAGNRTGAASARRNRRGARADAVA